MSFVGEGLFLGAGTRLATLKKDASSEFDIEGQEERILALLSVAYWRPISAQVLNAIRAAVHAYGRGEKVLPDIYLAQGGLPKIDNVAQAACRLFMADRLLAEGLQPRELLDGLGIDSGPVRLLKASPEDLKHPGWPAGTPDGLGGKFRPKDGDAAGDTAGSDLPEAIPVADFSDGFHDAVVNQFMDYYQKKGIPAVKGPSIRFIGPDNSVIGRPDIIASLPNLGLTVIEVKTGKNPPLTDNQRAYIPMLQYGGHIYTNDPRIVQLGLEPGIPFPPLKAVILFAPGPGLPYEDQLLPPPAFQP